MQLSWLAGGQRTVRNAMKFNHLILCTYAMRMNEMAPSTNHPFVCVLHDQYEDGKDER